MEVSSAPPNPPTGGSGGATSKHAAPSSNATNNSTSSPTSDGDSKINEDTVEVSSNMKSKVSPPAKIDNSSGGKEDVEEKMETDDSETSNNGVDDNCTEPTENGNGEEDICNESMEVDDMVRFCFYFF